MGTFKKGTVLPFPKNDPDQAGRFYYVALDGSHMTEGYLCMATHMRPLVEATPSKPGSQAQNQVSQPGSRSSASHAMTYKPGDRVQCDASQIGAWKAGVVMHYLQTDRYRDANGGYFRVRLDNDRGRAETFDPGGQVCMARFMRPFSDGYEDKAPNVNRRVSDRVEAQSYAGNWLPARITAIEGGFYTVRYDNYDSTHDETVDAVRLRSIGAGNAQAVVPGTKNDPTDLAPNMADAFPALQGTAWKIDWGIKGGNVQRFLFCRSGRWEVVSSQLLTGGAMSMTGSYNVQGSSLVTKDTNGGKVTNYRMVWNKGILELDSGKVKMRLYDPVETQCK